MINISSQLHLIYIRRNRNFVHHFVKPASTIHCCSIYACFLDGEVVFVVKIDLELYINSDIAVTSTRSRCYGSLVIPAMIPKQEKSLTASLFRSFECVQIIFLFFFFFFFSFFFFLFGGGDYILWALRTDHDLSCKIMVRISVGNGSVRLHSIAQLVLERGDAQLHGCSYATLCCVGTWKLHNIYNELYCMMGASHDERRCRPGDPWMQ